LRKLGYTEPRDNFIPIKYSLEMSLRYSFLACETISLHSERCVNTGASWSGFVGSMSYSQGTGGLTNGSRYVWKAAEIVDHNTSSDANLADPNSDPRAHLSPTLASVVQENVDHRMRVGSGQKYYRWPNSPPQLIIDASPTVEDGWTACWMCYWNN
jgi:hypothetical protein